MGDDGTIFKIKKYALHDGPGIRTTVFFKGCPLACRWCHNPEGIDPAPQTLLRFTADGTVRETVGQRIRVAELIRIVERDHLFYDESGGGVTFSGGEPLAQPGFLAALLLACRQREIHAALDTSGFAPKAVVARILPLVDLVLCDLKVMDAVAHRRYTGVNNRPILDNLSLIASSGVPLRLRVPLIPGMTDDDVNLEAIARFAATLKSVDGIDLLLFHRIADQKYRRLGRENPMAGKMLLDDERVAAIRKRFEAAGFHVSIGG